MRKWTTEHADECSHEFLSFFREISPQIHSTGLYSINSDGLNNIELGHFASTARIYLASISIEYSLYLHVALIFYMNWKVLHKKLTLLNNN
jgi:hypothetical protein